ncbi:hypothetical protein DFH28DRAFT_1006040 [Melampsora americana]|nr:hypothetical protein DFH28DRAFT_1006040 [Melampsora americana]
MNQNDTSSTPIQSDLTSMMKEEETETEQVIKTTIDHTINSSEVQLHHQASLSSLLSSSSIKTTIIPTRPIDLFATPKPGSYSYHAPRPVDPKQEEIISSPSALTPLRAHYLKRELVTLQFAIELEHLSTPHALSVLGPPFLPAHAFTNGIPNQPPASTSSKQSNKNASSSSTEEAELPFLRFFFHHFVLTFPFLLTASPSFFSHKLQPFFYSFFSRNISGSEDRDEETKRKKIAGKVEKHLGLVLAAAIKLTDNHGQEEVIRVSASDDPTPNDDDAFVPTPTLTNDHPIAIAAITANPQSGPSINPLAGPQGFDVNIVGIRRIRTKGRVRSKFHEEFLIRTRIPGADDVYVSRRYGDFVKLAQSLRTELPESDIRGPPAKDRRAIDGTSDISPPESPRTPTNPRHSTDSATQPTAGSPIHFTRERNRLTLRAYLHRLLNKPEVSNSELLRSFLIDHPIELTSNEKQDVEARAAMDRAREKEHLRFKAEVEGRVRELDQYLRGFREELVKSDGLSRVFGTIRKVDKVENLPIEYRKVIEWARISLASTVYQIFLGSDNSSSAFAQLKRMHGLMPYWAMRGVLRVSNPVAMIRGIIDLFLARPFGATSLLQRMFSSGLYEEIRELSEDAEKVAAKIADDRMCERVRHYVSAPREIQEVLEADAKLEGLDIIAIILRSEGSSFDASTLHRIQRASKAYEAYKAMRDSLEDPESNQGPTDDDAWLFEDLHVYMRLLRRCRDKEQMIELIFEGTTSELLKDIVTIFYAPLMQVYKAANISDSLADLQKFIDDLIKTVERAEEFAFGDSQKIVQTFVDLVARHEGSFYNFVHEVHSKGAGLFDGLMHWIELFVNFVRQGLKDKVTLETLLPHPDTPERLELIHEIDLVIEYHQKLKIAHHQRMTKRLGRTEDVPRPHQQGYTHAQDTAFVQGVMANLNLSTVVGADVEEAAREDHQSSTDESISSSDEGSMREEEGQKGKKKGSKLKDRVTIEAPELKLIPNLVPLFTELVKQLLH